MLGFAAFLKANLHYHDATYDCFVLHHSTDYIENPSCWFFFIQVISQHNRSLDQNVNLLSLPNGVKCITNRKLNSIKVLSYLHYFSELAKRAALLVSAVKAGKVLPSFRAVLFLPVLRVMV